MDPAKFWEKQETFEIREKYGCAVCTKIQVYWGQAGCQKGNKPGPRGFCPDWYLDEQAEPLRVVG